MGRNDAVVVPTSRRRVYTYDPDDIDFNLQEGDAHTIRLLGYDAEIFVRKLREKNITLQLCEQFRKTVEPLMLKDGGVTVEDPIIYRFRYNWDTQTMTLCLCLKCNDIRFEYEMHITMTKPSSTSDEKILTITLPASINRNRNSYRSPRDDVVNLLDLFGPNKAFTCSLNDFSLANLKDTVGTNTYSNHACIIWKKMLFYLTLTSLADSGNLVTITSVHNNENTYQITALYTGYNPLVSTEHWTNTISISAVFTTQPTPLVEVTHDDSEYTNTCWGLSKYKPPLTELHLKMWTASELKQFILKFRGKKPLRSMLADLNHRMDMYIERPTVV
jgi:hypothetical protein